MLIICFRQVKKNEGVKKKYLTVIGNYSMIPKVIENGKDI